jgi:polysaccharide pyruvyl transferase CsaB
MPSIGITGSYGGLNSGDEAILTAMLTELRDRVHDVRLTVFSRRHEHTRAHHDVHAVVPVRELGRDEAREHVEPLDLLLLGGGGILHDGEARTYLREVKLAQQLGVPTMAYAIGAGPLSYEEDRRHVRDLLGRMHAVTVRDPGSKRILEHAEVDCRVEVTADPALLLAPRPLPRKRLAAEGIRGGRSLFGMSLREQGLAAPELDAEAYHMVMAHIADFVCDRFDAEVVFIPMEHQDIRLSHAVMAKMEGAEHAHVLTGTYEPGELLGLMDHLDMVIGMRLHVLIFAALAGTPMFALPYAPKVSDFVEGLGLSVPRPISRDSVGSLLASLDRAWDERARHVEHIRRSVERLQEESRRTVDIALRCLRAAVLEREVLN